jgi:Ser/Thr protein kinase RdoA (MazF antagonist)
VPGAMGRPCRRCSSPRGGRRDHAVAFERLPGNGAGCGRDALRWFERLGEVSAKMHGTRSRGDAGRDFAASAGMSRPWWERRILGLVARCHGLGSGGRGRSRAGVVVIEERIARFGVGPDVSGWCMPICGWPTCWWTDAHLRIIDFDDCGFSWFMYDFAAAVSFIEHEPIVPESAAACGCRGTGGWRRCRPRTARRSLRSWCCGAFS